jgi:Kef-type K+ transport system membrane component KefB
MRKVDEVYERKDTMCLSQEAWKIRKKIKIIIGCVSCLLLFSFGVYSLSTDGISFAPALFVIGGFIGSIGSVVEWKKNKRALNR